MFEHINYNPTLNCMMFRSDGVRYYFDWDGLFSKIDLQDEESFWWSPETMETDQTIKIKA